MAAISNIDRRAAQREANELDEAIAIAERHGTACADSVASMVRDEHLDGICSLKAGGATIEEAGEILRARRAGTEGQA
jgi:hypothetical protein